MAEAETIKQVIEDTLLTAAKVRNGDYYEDLDDGIDEQDMAGPLSHRIAEVVVNLAERLAAVSGIDGRHVWTPRFVEDMLDPWWGTEYQRKEG